MEKGPDIRRTVGVWLRGWRNRKGWTQEDVAERAGVTTNYYSEVERGLRNITLLNLQKLLQALEVSIEDLLPSLMPGTSSDDEAAILEAISRLLRRGSKKSKRQVRVILQALVSES